MSLLANRAKTIIASSKLSPVEKNILTQTFLIASCDAETAAREILQRIEQDGVPLEEALRGLKHDWYRILELLSERTKVDDDLHQKLLLRDNGRCCLTGAIPQGTEAQPFHIISPALQRMWLSRKGHNSVLSCLKAFITPENANTLRQILDDASPRSQLKNAMLLSPTVGQAFWSRDIWLAESTEGSNSSEARPELQTQDRQYAVFGFACEDDHVGEDTIDGVQLLECFMHTDDSDYLPLPNPALLRIHSFFAKAAEVKDVDREVAKPWPPAVSPSYWSRRWQLRFRQVWNFVPAFIRRWVYRQLIYRGQRSAISEIVYNLPLGLYAKFCGDAHGEPAALKLLETHSPSVPSPLFVDLMPLVAGGKPWLIMTGLPGQRVDEVIHRMSYPERHRLADDLAAAASAYRRIPNVSKFLIASASGGRLQDPRASSNGCGPYQSEAEFNKQIARGCTEDLAHAFPNAHSREHPVVFTHADLFPSNILVDAGRLSGIVDWQFAGFYPAYWEYTKAMRSVRHAEHYQAIFRRFFGTRFEEELEVEEYLSGYFPIWGPEEPLCEEGVSS